MPVRRWPPRRAIRHGARTPPTFGDTIVGEPTPGTAPGTPPATAPRTAQDNAPPTASSAPDDTARRELTALLQRAADRDRPPKLAGFLVTGIAAGAAVASAGVLGLGWGAVLVLLVIAGVLAAEHRRHHHLDVPRVQQLPADVARPVRTWQVVTIVAVVAPATTLAASAPPDSAVPAIGAGIGLGLAIAVGGPIADHRLRRAAGQATGRITAGPNRHGG